MKLANFVTKLQDVLRPKQEETETIPFRKGKRITVPAKDVERVYRHQRKRVVRVTYTGPTKLTCRHCGALFLSLADGRGRFPEYHSNACKQKAYRERKKKEAKHYSSRFPVLIERYNVGLEILSVRQMSATGFVGLS
jgi:hypothetical protein